MEEEQLLLTMDKKKYIKQINGWREEEDIRARLKWYENHYGPYVQHRGMENWKNLFRKPTMLEWTILFMLLMGLFMAWAYKTDITACNDFYKQNVCYFCNEQRGLNPSVQQMVPNYSFTLKEASTGESGG